MHRREEYRALTTEIREVAEQVFLDLGYDPDYQPVIDNMWANINPRYACNRSHTHPDALWSGVYYVQVPTDSGRLCFVDPRPQASVIVPFFPRNVTPKREQWAEVYHEPVEERVILFPAWLQHEVQPNMSELDGPDGSRISVSFNLIQRRRQDPRDSAGQPPADAGTKPEKP